MARRLGLVGKPMTLEGTTLENQPYDLANEKGKVVLVMFWATWCAPCKAEIENLLQLYPLYHDRGFDVVGISIDTDRAKLEQFVKQMDIPWPILFSDKPGETGIDNPMAKYYGALGVPVMILVGEDGNVVSNVARGPNLQQELARLLGPPPQTSPISLPTLQLETAE